MPHYHLVLVLVLIAIVVAIYLMMVRPFLAARPELKSVFDRLDNQEAGITELFWNYFNGFRTILWSRFLMIAGAALPVLDQIGTVNLADLVKPEWAKYVPLTLLAIGLITEWLRHITTGPVPIAPPADPIVVDKPKA